MRSAAPREPPLLWCMWPVAAGCERRSGLPAAPGSPGRPQHAGGAVRAVRAVARGHARYCALRRSPRPSSFHGLPRGVCSELFGAPVHGWSGAEPQLFSILRVARALSCLERVCSPDGDGEHRTTPPRHVGSDPRWSRKQNQISCRMRVLLSFWGDGGEKYREFSQES